MDKNTLTKTVELFKSANNITVFTGAGISTSCGIPDFRGANGLYSFVQKKYNLPYPEAIFDINYFKKHPEPFFDLSKEIFDNKIKPSLSHRFVAWLEEQNKISLVMTQNIDMLHQRAGSNNVIECHGTYLSAHCVNCNKFYDIKEIESSLKKGEVPYCNCGGFIKPDIVFFGEQLPIKFFDAYHTPPNTDLLLIIGTSLMVQPAASFALKLAQYSSSIIVNLEPTEYDQLFTYSIYENLDSFSKEVWDNLKKEE